MGVDEGCNARHSRTGATTTHKSRTAAIARFLECQRERQPQRHDMGAGTRVPRADLRGQRLDYTADGAGAEVRLQVLTQLEQLLGGVGGQRGDGGGGQRREAAGRRKAGRGTLGWIVVGDGLQSCVRAGSVVRDIA